MNKYPTVAVLPSPIPPMYKGVYTGMMNVLRGLPQTPAIQEVYKEVGKAKQAAIVREKTLAVERLENFKVSDTDTKVSVKELRKLARILAQ